MITLGNVLVATDFGDVSETALNYGRSLARTFGARLHVLHVTQNALAFTGHESIGVDVAAVQAGLDQTAMHNLHSITREDDVRELQASLVVRHGSSPAAEIIRYANDASIDVIVIGTHGRRPMTHLFLGSIAEQVVRTAPCPVLTVRHPEHEFVLPDALQVVTRRDDS